MGSLKIGKYFRLNASRSGVSVSGGMHGLRLSVGSKGVRSHVTVPGTGYTKTNTLFSFRKLWKKRKSVSEKASKKTRGGKVADASEEALNLAEESMVLDELVLVMPRRRPFGSFTDKAKADRLVNKAIEAYEQENYEQALTLLNEAHALNGDDLEVDLYLAVINYLYAEDYNKALEHFKDLTEEVLNEDMLLAIADCLIEIEDYDASIEVLESFKFEDDEDMERTTLLARNHLAKKNYEVAEAIFKATVGRKRKMTPYLMEAKYWMGTMYLRVGDYEQAKKHLMAVYLEDSSYEDIGRKIEELALSGDEAE